MKIICSLLVAMSLCINMSAFANDTNQSNHAASQKTCGTCEIAYRDCIAQRCSHVPQRYVSSCNLTCQRGHQHCRSQYCKS